MDRGARWGWLLEHIDHYCRICRVSQCIWCFSSFLPIGTAESALRLGQHWPALTEFNSWGYTCSSLRINLRESFIEEEALWENILGGGSVALKWWRDRMGDYFLPHRFIKRTFEPWENSTKQLLNAGRGHQAPRKAAHCLWKEVGQNIEDKNRDKRGRDRDTSGEGSLKREVSKHQETLSPAGLWRILESQRAT